MKLIWKGGFEVSEKRIFKNQICEVYRMSSERTIPGSWHIRCILNNNEFDYNMVMQYCLVIKTLRSYLNDKGVRIVGLYMESDTENVLQTWMLPFHISVLKELRIPTEQYQPYIRRYLKEFPENLEYEKQADLFDCELSVILKETIKQVNVFYISEGDSTQYSIDSIHERNTKNGEANMIEVYNLNDLPKAPQGFKYFSCIGGNKNFQCFLETEKLSRGEFLELYNKKLDSSLRSISFSKKVQIRQDVMYAIPGFMIVSPIMHYRNLNSLPIYLFYECFLAALFIRHYLYNIKKIKYVYIYYDEHAWKPSTAHFWVLPIFESHCEIGSIPQIQNQSIWDYMNSFEYTHEKVRINEYVNELEMIVNNLNREV